MKACVEIDNIKNLPFDVINFDKYLWNIKADPFFVFDKEFVHVDVLSDRVNWVHFLER